MGWVKKGLISKNPNFLDWSTSHCQVPIALVLNDRIRIFYSTRDKNNYSNTSFLDLDKNNLKKIIYTHNTPILSHGKPGTFDDSGIMPTSILKVGKELYLYYIGWTQKKTVPFHNSIGLAKEKNGVFEKCFLGPIITTTLNEPYFSGTSCVISEKNTYRMWYLSCIGWINGKGKKEPLYNLKYSVSNDGINWPQNGTVAIDLQPGEGGIASATVIKIENIYLMWFSVRKKLNYRNNKKNSYRIKMAFSIDGIKWKRSPISSLNLNISSKGWDSEMVAYPNVIKLEDKLILFYNGNGFGRSGFGYAEIKISEIKTIIKKLIV